MQILIVAATMLEIQPLMSALGQKKELGPGLYHFRYKDLKIGILITGVGMVATTYHLTKVLSAGQFKIVVNLGLAGSFDRALPLGAVVHVVKDRFSELGAEAGDKFVTMVQLGLMPEEHYVFEENVKNAPAMWKLPTIGKLTKVEGITVNTIHGYEPSIERVKRWFHPHVESMEGAACFYACRAEKVQLLQIRSVSNFVEKRNKDEWDIPYAVENLNKLAVLLIEDLWKHRKIWMDA